MYLCNYLFFSTISLCRWMKKWMPEQSSMQLANPKLKCIFLDVNLARLVDYDKDWPDNRISPWSAPRLMMIYVASKRLGLPSPVPKLPMINSNPRGKFGWEGSVNFYKVLVASKQLTTRPPQNIPDAAVSYVVQEIEELASSSRVISGPVALFEEGIRTAIAGVRESDPKLLSSVARGAGSPSGTAASSVALTTKKIAAITAARGWASTSQKSALSTTSAAGAGPPSLAAVNGTTTISSPGPILPLKRKNVKIAATANRPSGAKKKSRDRPDKSQKGSHQINHNKLLGVSTKALMAVKVNGTEAMSLFGDINSVSPCFTYIERQWLKHLILTVTKADRLLAIKENLSTDHGKEIHKVCYVVICRGMYIFVTHTHRHTAIFPYSHSFGHRGLTACSMAPMRVTQRPRGMPLTCDKKAVQNSLCLQEISWHGSITSITKPLMVCTRRSLSVRIKCPIWPVHFNRTTILQTMVVQPLLRRELCRRLRLLRQRQLLLCRQPLLLQARPATNSRRNPTSTLATTIRPQAAIDGHLPVSCVVRSVCIDSYPLSSQMPCHWKELRQCNRRLRLAQHRQCASLINLPMRRWHSCFSM